MVALTMSRVTGPQSSSASRLTAGALGFLLLIQSCDRPERRDFYLRDL
jgi:hypothetical protein